MLTERVHASEVMLDAAPSTRVEAPTAQPKADEFYPGRTSASLNGKIEVISLMATGCHLVQAVGRFRRL